MTKQSIKILSFVGVTFAAFAAFLLLAGFSGLKEDSDNQSAIASPDERLPIFDTHVHYKEPAWSLYSPEEVVAIFRTNRITSALVSSTPDEGTRMLYNEAPDIVIPFLRPYYGEVNSGNWYYDRSILDYFDQRLEMPIYKGLGEFHIHDADDADHDVIIATARKSVEKNLYLHIHSGRQAIEEVFDHVPEARILWAHAGMSDPPEVLARMFHSYENLWVDISLREYSIAPNGVLSPEWEALFLEFPDRITVGSDTWVNSMWERYEEIIAFDRVWLSQLPEDVARQIAYGNAEKLFR